MLLIKNGLLALVLLGWVVPLSAGIAPLALCMESSKPTSSPFSFELNSSQDIPLASLSKIITSFWAIKSYGKNYQFPTVISLNRDKNNRIFVHISGGKDPFWGRQMVYRLVSELNQRGIFEIEELTFDEDFLLNWEVTSFDAGVQSMRAKLPNFEQIVQTLKESIGANQINLKLYAEAREFVRLTFGEELYPNPRLYVKSIHLRSQNQNSQNRKPGNLINNGAMESFTLLSLPLTRYLKEMNLWSHNYVAEMIFLGLSNGNLNTLDFAAGKRRSSYDLAKFLEDLGFSPDEFQFVNGSGDSEIIGGFKHYNRGTCQGVIRLLTLLNSEAHLVDLLAVSAAEKTDNGNPRGTLGRRYQDLPLVMTAKTGTVNPAINMAGAIMTPAGPKYFAIFMGTDSKADWGHAREQIRDQVLTWISEFGRSTFDYEPPRNFGFDFIPYEIIPGFTKPFLKMARNLKQISSPRPPYRNFDFNNKIEVNDPAALSPLEVNDFEELMSGHLSRSQLSQPDHYGLTPLMHAAAAGATKVVQYLLNQGVPLNTTNQLGETALAMAISNDQSHIAQLLINQGSSLQLSKCGERGENLLTCAIRANDIHVAKYLHQLNPHLVRMIDEDGNIALDYAPKQPSSKMYQAVLQMSSESRTVK